MRNWMIALLTFSSVSFIQRAEADERNCRNIDDNSCWVLRNETDQPVRLTCSGYGEFINDLNLDAGMEKTMQFDAGWADGLGYFGVNIPLMCQITYPDTSILELKFRTIYLGDRIAIRVVDQGAIAEVRVYWKHPMLPDSQTYSARKN